MAQKLLGAHSQPSAEGSLSRLDARLRPEGERGPLVCNIETFASYYSSRAQSWELQALTRARPVRGPQADEFMKIAHEAWERGGAHENLEQNIENMLERIRRERGSGADLLDLKTGSGGLIEAEFLIQTLQMRNKIWKANWTEAVSALSAGGKTKGSGSRFVEGSLSLSPSLRIDFASVWEHQRLDPAVGRKATGSPFAPDGRANYGSLSATIRRSAVDHSPDLSPPHERKIFRPGGEDERVRGEEEN